MSSLLGNRLAGLPKIPKIKKKSTSSKTTSKTTSKTSSKKTASAAPRSPPKPTSKPIAPAPVPPLPSTSAPAPTASTSTTAKAESTAPSFPIELSDDDTLSELETSSSSESADSSDSSEAESDDDDDDDDDDDKSDAADSDAPETQPAPSLPFPFLSSVVLPPLPPLPPLPASLPIASTSKAAVPASAPAPILPPSTKSKPSPAPLLPTASTSAPLAVRPKPSKPLPPSAAASTSTPSSSSSASISSRPKSTSNHAPIHSPTDLAYSPSNNTNANATTTSGTTIPSASSSAPSLPPQRMSLRQVLALSLQEAAAEDEKKISTTRENTPDANEILNLSKGKRSKSRTTKTTTTTQEKYKVVAKTKEKKGKGVTGGHGASVDEEEDDSMTSSAAASSSSSSDSSESEGEMGGITAAGEDDAENELGNMEKEEERLLRAELNKRRKGKGRAAEPSALVTSVGGLTAFGNGYDDEENGEGGDEEEGSDDDEDETEDEEGLVDAWEQNARAMEQIRKKRSIGQGGGGGGELSFDPRSHSDDDGDSDVAVTDLPPGNGFGVVTWSDYDSFGSDDNDDGDEALGIEDEDQLAEVLLAENAGLAGEFEEELEQLFALSEAVVGPIRQDEYDAGDMWFEALSDYEGSTADDETEEGDGDDDDLDAEMIFGEDGQLKRMFGGKKKRRFSAIDSSAGESDEEDEDATDSDHGRDVELVRIGVRLDGERRLEGGDSADESTDSYHSEDEETESSCSDTDIYRYAPRTGALANLQAPTTADLASLVVEEPPRSTASSSSRPKPSRPSAPSTLEVPTFDHVKGKAKAKVPTFKRRLPKMGTFDTTERKNQASESDSGPKIVVVGSGDELAPSPFRVPSRKTRRRPVTSPRRARSDSRVSTTSGTSGSTSLDPGSNVGSPVLGNVVFPDFDLDSLLQASVFDATDTEDNVEDTTLVAVVDAGGATSSETDTGTAASKPPPLDFSRWNRIPIGAFRSRTMGGNGRTAPSQVLTAQAAATELRKNRHKRRNSAAASTTTTGGAGASGGGSGEPARKKKTWSRKGGSEDEVATSILRDHKAIKSSLRHTLGTSPADKKRKGIRSRMLTSPVLAPTTLPSSKPSSTSSLAAVAKAVFNKNKKKKRSSSRSKSPGSKTAPSSSASARILSRQSSTVPPPLTSSSTPSTNLLPLHSPLFPKLEI